MDAERNPETVTLMLFEVFSTILQVEDHYGEELSANVAGVGQERNESRDGIFVGKKLSQ